MLGGGRGHLGLAGGPEIEQRAMDGSDFCERSDSERTLAMLGVHGRVALSIHSSTRSGSSCQGSPEGDAPPSTHTLPENCSTQLLLRVTGDSFLLFQGFFLRFSVVTPCRRAFSYLGIKPNG
jgi:hypothetical protein